jgi:chloramphenicol O-acetyltransferase type A
MRYIDLETWARREHFEVFRTFDIPHFNICANVDLTTFYSFVKQHGISLNLATVYVLTRAANAVPEFRYRIRGEEVVEHEIVHPSSTIMGKGDVFSFCTMEYHENFPDFAATNAEKIALVQERPRLLGEDQGRDDLLFMTAIPWVSFTSFMHPLIFPVDSVPRFAWGKVFEEGKSLKMPLSVQAHHAVMDGLHMGRYFEIVQEYFQQPKSALGG